jgi:hypothetical protein
MDIRNRDINNPNDWITAGEQEMAQRIVALESLLRDILADEPKSVCAENGTCCPFCFEAYSHQMPRKGFHVVHSHDCIIERAKRLLNNE